MPWGRLVTVLGVLALVIAPAACSQSDDQSDRLPATEDTPTEKEPAYIEDLPSGVAADLIGTEWALVSLYGRVPLEDTNITLNIKDDRIEGSTGCNRYFSNSVVMDEYAFKAGKVASTKVGCSVDVMQQENAYLSALYNSASYRVQDDRLEIRDAAGETTLVYIRKG